MTFVEHHMVRALVVTALVVVVCACGTGGVDVSTEPVSTVALPNSTMPVPTTTATTATTVTTESSTLTLHVSNQSFADETVGITISIDGATVVDQDFHVEDQHNWITFELVVAPGDHEVLMTSSTGVTRSATFTMPADAHRWAVVDYWFYPPDPAHPGAGQTPPSFTFMIDDEPIYFA